MPNSVEKIDGKYRVVHKVDGKKQVTDNKAGTSVDGGGHASKKEAQKQAAAINISEANEGK